MPHGYHWAHFVNILLLSHSRNDPDAGASRVYHLISQGLAARGHYVETLHYENLGLPRQRLLAKAVEKLAMPQWIRWGQRKRSSRGFDVVMAPSGMGYALFRRLSACPGRPLLVNHLHGLNLFDYQARVIEALSSKARPDAGGARQDGAAFAFPVHKRLAGWLPIVWDLRGMFWADLTIVQNSARPGLSPALCEWHRHPNGNSSSSAPCLPGRQRDCNSVRHTG